MTKVVEITFRISLALAMLTVIFLIATWITLGIMWLGGVDCGFWLWESCTLRGTT